MLLAFETFQLPPDSTWSEVKAKYKRLLVQSDSLRVSTTFDVSSLLGGGPFKNLPCLDQNLVLKMNTPMFCGKSVPKGRVLLHVCVAGDARKRSVQKLAELTELLSQPASLPAVLTFSGEYMHPDKVPEQFRKVQEAKMYVLQLAFEILQDALGNRCWQSLVETNFRKEDIVRKSKGQIRGLGEKIQDTLGHQDDSTVGMATYLRSVKHSSSVSKDSSTKLPPTELRYFADVVEGKQLSSPTLN